MVENSKIEWTDHTFNPWIGCTKVSPGCDHCYAETFANRFGKVKWGAGETRMQTSESNWLQPYKWNTEALRLGVRKRVFCASLADVFDNEVPDEWRNDLWFLIESTPGLDWLLLTKRIGNAKKMLPNRAAIMDNIWLGASIVNQEEADRDIPKLLELPVRIRFLSMEPLLGPVRLFETSEGVLRGPAVIVDGGVTVSTPDNAPEGYDASYSGINWVIVGGESGRDARPMHPEWVRSLKDQCIISGVPFFFKQWGEWKEGNNLENDAKIVFGDGTLCDPTISSVLGIKEEELVTRPVATLMRKVGKKAAGRVLDSRIWNEFPE